MTYTVQMHDCGTGRGTPSSIVALQPENEYLDLSPFQDFVSYIEVSDFANTPTIKLQTAPVKEETYFSDLVTLTFPPGATGITPTVIRFKDMTPPLARWLRWRASGAAALWSVTFRIHLNANPVAAIGR